MTIFVETSATFKNFLSSAHLETQKITHFHSFVTRITITFMFQVRGWDILKYVHCLSKEHISINGFIYYNF